MPNKLPHIIHLDLDLNLQLIEVYKIILGLENSERDIASHVVKSANNSFYFVFCSPY
ncbi:MAG: hypothetical protein ACK52J_03425 [bacterium]